MSGYLFAHDGTTYDPAGRTAIAPTELQAHNLATEQAEIAWLQTGPDRCFLYVKSAPWRIGTWLGTNVATHVEVGPARRFPCFGPFPSVRRSVTCRIFGTLYHGWYFESSGSYCRLKKARSQ